MNNSYAVVFQPACASVVKVGENSEIVFQGSYSGAYHFAQGILYCHPDTFIYPAETKPGNLIKQAWQTWPSDPNSSAMYDGYWELVDNLHPERKE